MDLAELTAAVDRAFVVTAAGLSHWPDPRPDGRPPADEEYSRCLDPGKFRLLVARADAWVAALVDLGLGRTPEVPAVARREVRGGRRPARVVLVEPHADGAVPLLVLSWDPEAGTAARVEVQAGDPGVPVTAAPYCGCDACDDGSQRELEALDQAITSVVSGDWLHVELPDASVTATGDGWSASGRIRAREVQRLLEEARAGRSPHAVVRGARWW